MSMFFKNKRKLNMSEKQNLILHTMNVILFILLLFIIHKSISNNNLMIDKIVEISDKVGIECNVKTNKILHIEVHTLLK